MSVKSRTGRNYVSKIQNREKLYQGHPKQAEIMSGKSKTGRKQGQENVKQAEIMSGKS